MRSYLPVLLSAALAQASSIPVPPTKPPLCSSTLLNGDFSTGALSPWYNHRNTCPPTTASPTCGVSLVDDSHRHALEVRHDAGFRAWHIWRQDVELCPLDAASPGEHYALVYDLMYDNRGPATGYCSVLVVFYSAGNRIESPWDPDQSRPAWGEAVGWNTWYNKSNATLNDGGSYSVEVNVDCRDGGHVYVDNVRVVPSGQVPDYAEFPYYDGLDYYD